MKETRFISQNKEKWEECESLLKDRVKDPEKLANLFTQVMDDLSFSRTYYPNRSVRVYLNSIGRQYFNIIYSNRKEKRNRFSAFWTDELPQIMYASRKQMILSLVVFLFAAAIGVFSSMKDPAFAASILGESYVSMTKANIESGDPMAVYKSAHQMDMFLAITLNNIMVAFLTYLFGAFFSLGTIMILLSNGIMLGCFQYFFIERDLFVQSALSIWLHGTLEISSIVIAGGAGLVLGSGLVFPGTYSRIQAFQMSAIRSLKIMLGIVPIFVVAGLIESFLTRYTDVSDLLKLFLILLSAAFIIGYFVIYPWLKAKAGFQQPLEEAKLPATNEEPFHYDRIKTNADIIKDSFVFYQRYAGQFFAWIAGVSFIMCLGNVLDPFVNAEDAVYAEYSYEWYNFITQSIFHALQSATPFGLLVNSLGITMVLYRVIIFLTADAKNVQPNRYDGKAFLQTWLVTAAFLSLLHFLNGLGGLIAMFSYFFLIVLVFTQHHERINIFQALGKSFQLAGSNFGKVFGAQIVMLLLLLSFLVILFTPVLYYNTTILEWTFASNDTWTKEVLQFIEKYIKVFAFNLTLPIIAAMAGFLYFSLQEINSAQHLKNTIARITLRNAKKSKA
jgi:uncharacterized membrane protein SpoIIM required for sporulation